MLEEINLCTLDAFGEERAGGRSRYIRVVVQRDFAIDPATQRCNECLEIVEIARTDDLVEE